MRLVFDTSVWIEHLRRDALAPIFPLLRGKFQVSMDALVAAELIAGSRTRRERSTVDTLNAGFARTGRMQTASAADLAAAGRALSKLRERGVTLSNAAGALIDLNEHPARHRLAGGGSPRSARLIDAAIATTTMRAGALLVTENARDFERLATVLPLRWETLAALTERLSS